MFMWGFVCSIILNIIIQDKCFEFNKEPLFERQLFRDCDLHGTKTKTFHIQLGLISICLFWVAPTMITFQTHYIILFLNKFTK